MYLMYSFFHRFTTFLSTYLWGSSTVIYIYTVAAYYIFTFCICSTNNKITGRMIKKTLMKQAFFADPRASWLPPGVCWWFLVSAAMGSGSGVLQAFFLWNFVRGVTASWRWNALWKTRWNTVEWWWMLNAPRTTYFSVDLFFAHWNQRPSPRTLLFTAEIAATCREAKTWMAWSTNMAIYSKVVDSRISPTILSLHLFQCHGNLWESNNSRHDQGVIQLHQQFPKSLVFLFIKSQVLLVFFVHVKKPNVSKNI